MALKPDREFNEVTDISNFWLASDTTARERGGIASVVTQGSGAAMGVNITDEANVVDYETSVSSSTVPKGVLLQNIAISMGTRDFPNFEGYEIRPGEKCTLIKQGWVVTNMIYPDQTPAVGGLAYLGQSGLLATGAVNSAPLVGRFETTKDANGYCRVAIDIYGKHA